ncbi:hypothetical protein LF845_00535 [Deferribacterales bacterium Es71-Z0220]|uniref:hypothetical protein n=1 Tax=Deferrivibrio essentukiensis TaxID=2880922 RepID=UPI001F6137FF|nr:hypothetical protein [Deferrivibrio essentukiensis]MCB4203441.1 hypothetical protein [Deferrivibrio essentukiensis]
MKRISIILIILLLFLVLLFISLYKIPVFVGDDKFGYTYVLVSPFNSDENKILFLLQKLSALSESETEFDKIMTFQKVVIQGDVLRIYMSGESEASSSYNEMRMIEQLKELIRNNFDYIKKMFIIDDGKIFKHIDVRFPIIIED